MTYRRFALALLVAPVAILILGTNVLATYLGGRAVYQKPIQ